MNPYCLRLAKLFREHANPKDAPKMKAYMKNRFEYFGIKSPLRKELTKTFTTENTVPDFAEIEEIVFDLFAEPERELHYAAIELCGTTKKHWTAETVLFFEKNGT